MTIPIEEIDLIAVIDAHVPSAEPALDKRPTVTLSISTTTFLGSLTVHVESPLLRTGRCSIDVGDVTATMASLGVVIETLRWLREPTRVHVSVEDRVAQGILDELRGPPGFEAVVEVLCQEVVVGDYSVIAVKHCAN